MRLFKGPIHQDAEGGLPPAVCVPLFLALLLCASGAFAAGGGNAVRLDRVQSPDGPVLVVTATLSLKKEQRESPLAKVSLVNAKGNVLQRKESYGGRCYNPEMYRRVGRMTALAATRSLLPSAVGDAASRIYQFVFFDVPDTVRNVELSLEGSPIASVEVHRPAAVSPPKKHPPRPAVEASHDKAPAYGGAALRGEEHPASISLVSGSESVMFADRPVIKSFLEEELPRLAQKPKAAEDNAWPKAPAQPGHSPEQARELLASLGLVPIWEYVHIGMSPDEAQSSFASKLGGGAGVRLTVVDCASDICEYSLGGLGDTVRYRLYFKKMRLLSMVMVPAGGMGDRTTLLKRLEELYGGRVRSRVNGHSHVENFSSTEYTADYNRMRIQTLGRTLRVVGYE